MSRRPTPSTIIRDMTIPARMSPVEKEIVARTASKQHERVDDGVPEEQPDALASIGGDHVRTMLAEPCIGLVCGETRRTASEPLIDAPRASGTPTRGGSGRPEWAAAGAGGRQRCPLGSPSGGARFRETNDAMAMRESSRTPVNAHLSAYAKKKKKKKKKIALIDSSTQRARGRRG